MEKAKWSGALEPCNICNLEAAESCKLYITLKSTPRTLHQNSVKLVEHASEPWNPAAPCKFYNREHLKGCNRELRISSTSALENH